MRLIIIDNETIRRGAQMFGQHFKKHLNSSGHICKRIFLYSPEDETPLLLMDENDWLLQGRKKHVHEFFPSIQVWICRLIAKYLHEFEPDIILLNGARSVKYGGIVKRYFYKGNAPFVVRVIGSVVYWNRSIIQQLYSRYVITPKIDGAIGVGEKALNDYRSLYHFKGPGVFIPRSFDFNSFTNSRNREQIRSDLKIKSTHKIVLYLGSLNTEKRPDRFLRVFHAATKQIPEARAWVVGDGKLRSQMEKHAYKLGILEKVTFWGYQTNVESFIIGSDVLLITSDSEGVPGIAMESLYLERPVVTTNAGDVAIVVQHRKSGFISEIEDEKGLISNLILLLSNPRLARTFGINGRKYITQNFDLSRITDQYLKFFNHIIKVKNEGKLIETK